MHLFVLLCRFFFNDTATTEIYTLTHSFPTRRSSDLQPVRRVRPEIVVSLRQLRREVVERKTESRRPEQRRETAGQLLDGPVRHALALIHRPEHVLMKVEQHPDAARCERSEEHTSELQSLMRISYALFCLKKKTTLNNKNKRK